MPDEELVVYSSIQPMLAHLVLSALRNAGLPARLSGEHRAGMGGLIGMDDAMVEVRVPMTHQAQAQALLAPLFAPHADGGHLALSEDVDLLAGALGLSPRPGILARPEPAECPECGAPWEPGFDLCWQCETPLDPD
ncbi:MAG: DUF2007 domain-containing protein [Myxococcota bacterium]